MSSGPVEQESVPLPPVNASDGKNLTQLKAEPSVYIQDAQPAAQTAPNNLEKSSKGSVQIVNQPLQPGQSSSTVEPLIGQVFYRSIEPTAQLLQPRPPSTPKQTTPATGVDQSKSTISDILLDNDSEVAKRMTDEYISTWELTDANFETCLEDLIFVINLLKESQSSSIAESQKYEPLFE